MIRRLALGLAAIFAVAAVAYVFTGTESAGLDAAVEVADEGDRWRASADAADALAEIAQLLLDEAGTCDAAETRTTRCDALLQASGWAQVAAVRILRCTPAYVVDVRRDAVDLLAVLQETDQGPRNAPPTPVCGP